MHVKQSERSTNVGHKHILPLVWSTVATACLVLSHLPGTELGV